MSTSANVTHYEVYKDNKLVGQHRQNCMCKNWVKDELAQYSPASDYEVRLIWPDENEADHFTKRMLLSDYLAGKKVEWISYD